MDESLCEALSKACGECHLAGGCCFEARPPLSQERIDILTANGVDLNAIEFNGYKRLKLRQDGFCILFRDGKCSIHSFKPETCVAGPFTFDIVNNKLQIFLKQETICPMVRFLKADRKAYDSLFEVSVQKIMDLVAAIPPEEMAEILKIEEPETDLVAEIDL
ncbi:MAG: YkgJ family cysteine cluster protein [Methanothrix sp.]|jgi:Fe-S-cluster containining protein|nr:YkgJ family cysteine cluster protein [Methanothrix sp.]